MERLRNSQRLRCRLVTFLLSPYGRPRRGGFLLGLFLAVAVSVEAKPQVIPSLDATGLERRTLELLSKQVQLAPTTDSTERVSSSFSFYLRRSFGQHICGCGGVRTGASSADSAYVLPSDPALVLREAVLGAVSVEVCRLQPLVDVKDYPKGHFGDYERLGYLVMSQGESDAVDKVVGIFKELDRDLESHPYDYDLYAASPALTLEEYMKEFPFQPRLLFVFHGTYEASVLVDLGNQTAIIFANHRTGFYHVIPSFSPMLEYWATTLAQPPTLESEPRSLRSTEGYEFTHEETQMTAGGTGGRVAF